MSPLWIVGSVRPIQLMIASAAHSVAATAITTARTTRCSDLAGRLNTERNQIGTFREVIGVNFLSEAWQESRLGCSSGSCDPRGRRPRRPVRAGRGGRRAARRLRVPPDLGHPGARRAGGGGRRLRTRGQPVPPRVRRPTSHPGCRPRPTTRTPRRCARRTWSATALLGLATVTLLIGLGLVAWVIALTEAGVAATAATTGVHLAVMLRDRFHRRG